MTRVCKNILSLISCLSIMNVVCLYAQQTDTASIIANGYSISISYKQQNILQASITNSHSHFTINQKKEFINDCIYQTIVITCDDALTLEGDITGDEESIACESEPKDGLKYVRQVVGMSHNLRNQAVYDRKKDWLLSFDNYYNRVSIEPQALSDTGYRYHFTVTGAEIIIRFKPEYYKMHRGLHRFEPATYTIWKEPVVGWCSWFAYFNQIDEEKIKHAADVISKKLKPFGLEYLQMDDGYQQSPIGMPDTWLQPNKKFPSGLQNLAAYISNLGLKPAIWTNVSFADSAAAFQNKNLFVQHKNQPAKGNWVGYVMDGSQEATIDKIVKPVYASLQKQGWQYFKLDALRHLKYEGYNSYAEYFSQKNIDRNEAYRNIASAVRKEIGNDHFLLACWGIRPELVGIADGCRIGNDGYSYAGLAQFNSYNNIVWRIDPDHIVLSDQEAYRSCTATSLTGSLFMLTDKPEKYEQSPLIEAARRSIPVLYTQPGQVYDVDPSRSNLIAMADVEMSGSGPRVFDASSSTTTGLFLMEINKAFENWMVLGRLDERDKTISLKDLGLDSKKKYLIFEFWSKKFMGEVQNQFQPPAIDSNFHCQVFSIREKKNHPQLIATNRHISCGALELKDCTWANNKLTGISSLTAGDDYTIYIYEPANFNFKKLHIDSGEIIANKKEGSVRTIRFQSSSLLLKWEIDY
ncbi:MAG: alpha-galactosidase [Bacteroidetes bacterium]|nr:alpha-galactosidase [Bacteroidota bacterium]